MIRSSWRLAAVLGVLTSLTACGTGYPLPPTQCDDWCHATQRNHCREDKPADCVAACEQSAAHRAGCHDAWTQLIACYAASPDSDFSCQAGAETSQPHVNVCASQRQALASCRNAASPSCLRFCIDAAALCSNESPAPCSENCTNDLPACSNPYNAYFECLDRELSCEAASDVCSAERNSLNACVQAWQ